MPLDQLPGYVLEHTLTSILHNWPFLLLGILSAAALKVYVGTDRVASLLRSGPTWPSADPWLWPWRHLSAPAGPPPW